METISTINQQQFLDLLYIFIKNTKFIIYGRAKRGGLGAIHSPLLELSLTSKPLLPIDHSVVTAIASK